MAFLETTTRKTATILIAEDDASIRNGVADLLQVASNQYDITVHTAANGLEAFKMLDHITPDLVITDLGMPEMDGYQLLKAVRKQAKWIHIPFIFLTAKVSRQEIHRGRLTGVELYLTKPFNSEDLVNTVEVILDKTRQQQEFRLEKSHDLKREILQSLQHEFRTPLTHVTAYYEILMFTYEDAENPQELQEYLHGIQVGSKRLHRLVNDLSEALALNTNETQTLIAEKSAPISNLSHLLEDVLSTKRTEFAEKEVSLLVNIPASLPKINGHAPSLKNAFTRLIDNAYKFTTKKEGQREVKISAEIKGDRILISFKDSGVGFPPHVADQLFELFYQFNRDEWEQQGAGVGLTIAKGLIEAHQGTLVACGGLTKGAEFLVSLPIYKENVLPSSLGSAGGQAQGLRPAVILAVEDDPALLDGLVDLLTFSEIQYRFNVISAQNGQQALEILDQTRPDLILSDIMMPLVNGFELYKKVKENPDWLVIPFVFLTAKGDPRDILEGTLLGADDYITKPYDTKQLIELLETRLNRYFEMSQASIADFNSLKESILASLEVSFQNSISSVSDHSAKLHSHIEDSQTIDELKESLNIIQESSNELTQLVENFTTLVEIRIGAAQSAMELRANDVAHLSAMLQDSCLASAMSQSDFDKSSVLFEINHGLPVVRIDPVAIDKVFTKFFSLAAATSEVSPSQPLIFSAETTPDQQVLIQATNSKTKLSAEQIAVIDTFLSSASGSENQQIEHGSDFAIVNEYVKLHQGEFSIEPTEHGHRLKILLPAANSLS